jgi:lauroyl/myristoyl acyltransferase
MADDPRPATARQQATYLTYRTLGEAIARVPEPVAATVAAIVGAVMARRPGLARTMAERNLTRVLASTSPVVAPDPALVRRWARRSFLGYARYWVEGARLPSVPAATVLERWQFESGFENLTGAVAEGRGAIVALPHVGSWEWGGAFLALAGMPMTAVAEVIEPPQLYDWFVSERRRMGLTIVPLGAGSSAEVVRTLRAGGLVGLVCDRDLAGNGVPVEFFGETTTMPAGPATLALRTGAALLPTVIYSGPGRDHTAIVRPRLDATRSGSLRTDVARLTQELATAFEGFVRRAPEQWHLFQPNWPSDHRAVGGE